MARLNPATHQHKPQFGQEMPDGQTGTGPGSPGKIDPVPLPMTKSPRAINLRMLCFMLLSPCLWMNGFGSSLLRARLLKSSSFTTRLAGTGRRRWWHNPAVGRTCIALAAKNKSPIARILRTLSVILSPCLSMNGSLVPVRGGSRRVVHSSELLIEKRAYFKTQCQIGTWIRAVVRNW